MTESGTQACSFEPAPLEPAFPPADDITAHSLLRRPRVLLPGLGRGFALFIGAFCLLNVLGEWRYPGFDANPWWIDLRPMSHAAGRLLLGLSGLALVSWGLHHGAGGWLRWTSAIVTVVLLVYGIRNTVQLLRLWADGAIDPAFPLPFSILVVMALMTVLADWASPHARGGPRQWLVAAVALAVCLVLFPLAQMFCFGKTDYRRPANAAVVFGARAYASGRPSDALADRIRTGCDLYREGLVKCLIFSGGPGDGAVHETEAMRRMAIELGVPADAIVLDAAGVNTQATVRNTTPMFKERGLNRILAVSHFYHLPRIKMTYQREACEVITVPAKESYTLTQMPFNLLREIAALWVYYLRPLVP